jgi:hypothetical protein
MFTVLHVEALCSKGTLMCSMAAAGIPHNSSVVASGGCTLTVNAVFKVNA